MKILNITNGDGVANVIKESSIKGDVLPWRDPMHHGPFPTQLDLCELSSLRARYLVGPDADQSGAERDFQLRDQHLKAANTYDNVTLWFEHDLLDQLQILQILDWFSEATIGDTMLDMICINNFPGEPNFRGIGQLNADQVASLSKLRRPVTDTMKKLAAAGWEAFRSSDPNNLLTFLKNDLSELPFLATALYRHFEEFPSAETGLTRTEVQLLQLISDGLGNPEKLFVQNMELEDALFIGDWPTYRTIDALCSSGLITCEPSPFIFPSFAKEKNHDFGKQRLILADAGREVVGKDKNAFGFMQRDGWLGGVKLQNEGKLWTWDHKIAQFSRREI